jgi:hypothetical protein
MNTIPGKKWFQEWCRIEKTGMDLVKDPVEAERVIRQTTAQVWTLCEGMKASDVKEVLKNLHPLHRNCGSKRDATELIIRWILTTPRAIVSIQY